MLKKLVIVSIAIIASSGIAFADTTDTMSSDSNTPSTSADTSATAAPKATPRAHHRKHARHKHHRTHHQAYKSADNSSMPAVESTESAPVATANYKGEVVPAPVNTPCPSCAHNPLTSGLYLGLGIGSRVNYTNNTPTAYTGLQGTVLGGYSMNWDDFYTGLEIFIQDNMQINNYSTSRGSAKSSWGYGFSVLPGYLIADNVLGFARLGIISTRFSTGNTMATGGQVGLGMQTALCMNWDLRGEYIYSFYNSLTSGTVGNPKSQEYNLSLIYKL